MKKRRWLFILVRLLILFDICIVYFLCANRAFSHLAIWNIRESGKTGDFYWTPAHAPAGFRFEADDAALAVFRNEIRSRVEHESDELKRMLAVAAYVAASVSRNDREIQWGVPVDLWKQIQQGASHNCFHRSIALSSFLSSIGMKTRVWALENERFKRPVHSIVEVYLEHSGRWVFVDPLSGFYATRNGVPLSFIELRRMLLTGQGDGIVMNDLQNNGERGIGRGFYAKLSTSAFLRTRNDFTARYKERYGFFTPAWRVLDRAPESFRRGAEYVLGSGDVFIHYSDEYSPSLTGEIVCAKALFYFLLATLPLLFFYVLRKQ